MAKITFRTKDNETIIAEGNAGSVMELAVEYNVRGIDGDCGGVCSCATCHIHLASEDMDKTDAIQDMEKDMLEFEDNVSEFSRLSCQMKVTDAIDGIIIKVAN